jgi:ABC-type oligopeptide transport system substrate-binding subunit
MKLVVRVLAAAAAVALATPAFACGEMKQTTTASTQTKAQETQPVAKTEKKAAKPAKAQKAAKTQTQAQTAQN